SQQKRCKSTWVYTFLGECASTSHYSPSPPSAYAVPTMLYRVTTTPEVNRAMANTTLAMSCFMIIPPRMFRLETLLNGYSRITNNRYPLTHYTYHFSRLRQDTFDIR